MTRVAVLCPGRGSYTRRSLGSLQGDHELVARAEAVRAEYGLTPLRELDGAARFDPLVHLKPSNVSPLIYTATLLDVARVEGEVVAVGGNSLGWYTALAAAGALPFEDGFRLVQEMSLLQEPHPGGQVLYPLIDDQWHRDPRQEARVQEALEAAAGEAFWSIDLGGYAVLAGSERGVATLMERLPPAEMGTTAYPARLAQHGPYHTPLLQPVAEEALRTLARLEFRAPETTLVDGRGARHTPWSADPDELAAYTLGEQVTTPFLFARTVRVILREYAPDLLWLPGPGNSLGGICGQILVAEGRRGIRSRADFERVQASDRPVVFSAGMGR